MGLVLYLADSERFVRVEQNAMDREIEIDVDAMHTILSDHGTPTDGTRMRSMCMHPKHAGGKQRPR